MLIKIIDLQMILPVLYYILTLNVVLICAVFHQKIHKNVGTIFLQLSNNLLEILLKLVPSLYILIGVP